MKAESEGRETMCIKLDFGIFLLEFTLKHGLQLDNSQKAQAGVEPKRSMYDYTWMDLSAH